MTTDPITLAREVLDRDGEDIAAVLAARPRVESLDLARAVLRVEALAEKHEGTARSMGTGSYGGALAAKIAQDIRAALNGDDA